jgi:hypothetical protein
MDISALPSLLAANSSLDWRQISIEAAADRGEIVFIDMPRESALAQLLAHQRILRILPAGEEHRALPLLSAGLHSAIQIASIPEHEFERHWAALFPNDAALGLHVYRTALNRRGELLHRYLNEIQRNEPHYQAARFK